MADVTVMHSVTTSAIGSTATEMAAEGLRTSHGTETSRLERVLMF